MELVQILLFVRSRDTAWSFKDIIPSEMVICLSALSPVPHLCHHEKTPWVDPECADCPGFLVPGVACALASSFV